MMGSERDDRSSPVHRVAFGAPFYVGRTEVTLAQWDACVAGGGCDGYRPADEGWGRETRPVINVSWQDAKLYVAWLTRRIGKACRLPREAEWEYAARAGTTTEYALPAPNGSDDIAGRGLANCADCGSEWGDKQTAPVGSFKPNARGVYDMHGNVSEWVEDCWHDSYQGAPEDGQAWREEDRGNCSYRMLRGGSWRFGQDRARSAFRYSLPSSQDSGIGFRVLCSFPSTGH
jgi:formylglycine-generating enzyme required for sulfatase activity